MRWCTRRGQTGKVSWHTSQPSTNTLKPDFTASPTLHLQHNQSHVDFPELSATFQPPSQLLYLTHPVPHVTATPSHTAPLPPVLYNVSGRPEPHWTRAQLGLLCLFLPVCNEKWLVEARLTKYEVIWSEILRFITAFSSRPKEQHEEETKSQCLLSGFSDTFHPVCCSVLKGNSLTSDLNHVTWQEKVFLKSPFFFLWLWILHNNYTIRSPSWKSPDSLSIDFRQVFQMLRYDPDASLLTDKVPVWVLIQETRKWAQSPQFVKLKSRRVAIYVSETFGCWISGFLIPVISTRHARFCDSATPFVKQH